MFTYLRRWTLDTSYRVIRVVLCLCAKYQLRHGLRESVCVASFYACRLHCKADKMNTSAVKMQPPRLSCVLAVRKYMAKQTGKQR